MVDRADDGIYWRRPTAGSYTSADGGTHWTQRRSGQTWSLAINPGRRSHAKSSPPAVRRTLPLDRRRRRLDSVNAARSARRAFDRLAIAIAPSNPAVAGRLGCAARFNRLPLAPGRRHLDVRRLPTGRQHRAGLVRLVPRRCARHADSRSTAGPSSATAAIRAGTTWTWRTLATKAIPGKSIHPDQHAIAFEPGQPELASTSATTAACSAAARPRHQLAALQQWPGHHRVRVPRPGPRNHPAGSCGGTQDNGTERWTGSPTWTTSPTATAATAASTAPTPTTVFHTYYGMSPSAPPHGGDFGHLDRPSRRRSPQGEGSLFYPPFEPAPDGRHDRDGRRCPRTSRANNGTDWTRLRLPAAGSRSSAMFIPDPTLSLSDAPRGGVLRTIGTGTAGQRSPR